MIQLQNIALAFGGTPLFTDLTWTITPDAERIGLIGPNGAGKSTLLKVIAGEQPVDSGHVSTGRLSVGYLEQDVHEMPADRSVRAEAQRAFDDVLALEAKEEELTAQLDAATDYESEAYQQLLDRLARVQEQLHAHEAHRMRSAVDATLTGLGFAPDDLDRPLRTFSGGWRMRVALAKLLLQRPDVLLLDEPTNHLDIDSIDWLEGYLKSYPGTVIIVSHDRYFLDRMVTQTVELAAGRLAQYDGNYSHYLEARKERRAQWQAEYENQQRRIKEIEDFIDRFRYNASKASQVQSRIKKLERMERIPPPPSEEATMQFRFPEPPRVGRVVLELSTFSKTYAAETGPVHVFDNAGPLTVERGDKIALIGPNGAGKSTLARILKGTEPFEGTRELGHNAQPALFAQHQADTLAPDQTVLEAVRAVAPGADTTALRTLLGTFLFTGDDVFKEIKVLSGGERSRVALARTLLRPANLLLLDEPTNHLDIQSKQVLIEALQQYSGTFVIVSHDRHFLDAVAERIWRVGDGGVRTFPGTYSEFRWKRAQEQQASEPSAGDGAAASAQPDASPSAANDAGAPDPSDGRFTGLNSYQLKQTLEATEAAILEKEEKQAALQKQMATPEAADGSTMRELSEAYQALDKELATLYDDWDELTERVLALDA
ncbi:ABC-F family ATP-binding cassette domain-containing protein [Salisaeta longa]|uniref:ABC-F family ATP-binding cassette domain-containing protein n=1 Tax=Salisaeta longa TaxID=503170 RepID=UPI0003B4092B|nr:ABC-F family ATP-binding cassette domain-containing protein [Salisaeta longa]